MDQNKVFLIGVFDMFHEGHLNLLKRAAKLGQLTVGIVPDEAVKKQKGENRPIIPERSRIEIVRSLKYVFGVHLMQDFEFPKYVFEEYDLIVVGEDQRHIKNLDAIPFMKRVDLNRTEGISTSQIIKRIKQEVIDNYNKNGKLEV